MLCKGIFGQANIFNAFQLLVPHYQNQTYPGPRPTQTYPTYRILEGQDFHPISAAAHFLTVDFLSRGALDNLS